MTVDDESICVSRDHVHIAVVERGDAREELGRVDPALMTDDVVHPRGIFTSTENIKTENQVPKEPIRTGPLFSAALVVLSH